MPTNDSDTNSKNGQSQLTIPSADVVRLVQAFLTESGLHESCRVLQHESGVGQAGMTETASYHSRTSTDYQHSPWYAWATSGQWGTVLSRLRWIDAPRARLDEGLRAAVHQMAVLELADQGEYELAYAAYRLVQPLLAGSHATDQDLGPDAAAPESMPVTRASLVEQLLAQLAALRAKSNASPKALPDDYYGYRQTTPQARREFLGQALTDAVPIQPKDRLVSLLQQALKWQIYTGELPKIQQHWPADDSEAKGKKRKRVFDLVLGTSHVDPVVVGETNDSSLLPLQEPTIEQPYATVKLGKHVTATAAVFLPPTSDGSGSCSLVTGSSDGLIEIWDPVSKYSALRTNDFPYQAKDELLGMDASISALAVSNDGTLLAGADLQGTVQVWRVDTGKCLRSMLAHSTSISALAFSPDASHVLTASRDGTAREFGLRTSRMLKEFQGHASYVNTCGYVVSVTHLLVVTGSADGTVRIFDGKTSETLRILKPKSLGLRLSEVNTSLLADEQSDDSAASPSIQTVLFLHTPAHTMVVVPRGRRAFLVAISSGIVLRTFEGEGASDGTNVFVAACASVSNRVLYIVQEDGSCCVFDTTTGERIRTVADFASQSAYASKDPKSTAILEISALVHHPIKPLVGAYCSDKIQKKGQLVLWK